MHGQVSLTLKQELSNKIKVRDQIAEKKNGRWNKNYVWRGPLLYASSVVLDGTESSQAMKTIKNYGGMLTIIEGCLNEDWQFVKVLCNGTLIMMNLPSPSHLRYIFSMPTCGLIHEDWRLSASIRPSLFRYTIWVRTYFLPDVTEQPINACRRSSTLR